MNNKTPMREQEANIRNKNFSEVALGYNAEEAQCEAARCINCKNKPCMQGCPVNVEIPAFISKIKEGDFEGAYDVITLTNSLPAVCGRVCPQESQCEKYCVRSIKGESVGIGRLERFAADNYTGGNLTKPASNGHKIAIIGAGPAGLSCAGDLAKKGYDVTIFEAFHIAGGVLVYGIPEFRLPKDIVAKEIGTLEELGVKVMTNMVIGKVLTLDELFVQGFEAIFIGTGAGLPAFMKIEGENLNGVFSANETLSRINLMKGYLFPQTDTPVKLGRRVAVVGGGNVAMDAARSSKRIGAEDVYIIYRRSEEEMPARAEEIHHAKEEGIELKLLTNPTRILGDESGNVTGIECVRMDLGEADSSGRRRPVTVKGSEHIIDVDTVIMAIGQTPNPLIRQTTENLKTQSWGGIIADEETCATSIPGVYAGGDAVSGAATVILAMGAGKKAAKAIHIFLEGKSN